MPERYLLCPQCGTHRFFVRDAHRNNVYFHVDGDRRPCPTAASRADLTDLDFSVVHSTGCSWTGSLKGLVKFLP